MNADITPLVAATIARHAAQTRLDLERLRSAREATETVSMGGQSRALALGKRIRYLTKEAAAWDVVVAFTEDADTGFDERSVPADVTHACALCAYEEPEDTPAQAFIIGYAAHDRSGFRCVTHEPLAGKWVTLYAGSDWTGSPCTELGCNRIMSL